MSALARSDLSRWRRSATLVLAAGWTHPGLAAASLPPPPVEDYRLLLLERSESQHFLPGAYVFPGGVLDAADRSASWLCLFAPHHGPPHFNLVPRPPPRTGFPVLPPMGTDAADGDDAALPYDVAFRICAIRETFEEASVLVLRPRASLAAAPESPDKGHTANNSQDQYPNNQPHNWDQPSFLQQTFVFSVESNKWLSPSEAIKSFLSEEILMINPQFYEIRRLENFASLSDLHRFCLDHVSEQVERWMPIILLTADGEICLLPGDELYLEDSYFVENVMFTEKRTEELMKEGKKFH